MNTPVHFDLKHILAEHDRLIEKLAGADVAGADIQVRIAKLVGRAFVEFVVGERNRETDATLVAGATAAAVANMIETLTQNFPGPFTAVVFARTLQRANHPEFDSVIKVHPMQGGNA
jgi:hypothetical protein